MGQLGRFSSFFACFRAFLVPVGVLWWFLGALGGLGGRFGLSGRGKADSSWGLLSVLRVRAVCLVGRCPWGEAVGEDVSAGRLEVLGPGRSGGFLGLGSFDREGLFEVVGDGQG